MSEDYNFSQLSLNLDTSAPPIIKSLNKRKKPPTRKKFQPSPSVQSNFKGKGRQNQAQKKIQPNAKTNSNGSLNQVQARQFPKSKPTKDVERGPKTEEAPREQTAADDYETNKKSTSFQLGKDKKRKKVETGSHKKAQGKRLKQSEGDGDLQTQGVKHKRTDGIISSLFNNNPEIPQVESTKVDVVSEEVFAGKTFKDLPLHPFLVSTLQEKLGFTELTQIQKKAIPVLLEKKDVLIKSQTGSGKTLAYAVPIIQSLHALPRKVKREDGPYALVVVPTRELAIQTYDILVKLLRTFIWIVPGCLMGGEKKKAEKARLRKGVNILVTTPGRLLDHINTTNNLHLSRINWLVIDEADRLLELGYEKDVAQILNALNEQNKFYNTVLLSATLSEGVERLSSITLKDPVHVSISPDGGIADGSSSQQSDSNNAATDVDGGAESGQGKFSVPSQLNQFFIVTPGKLRLVTLASWILWKCRHTSKASKMIVFMSTQDMVEFHWQLFTKVLNRNVPEKKKKPPVKPKTPAAAAAAAFAALQEEEVPYNNIKENVPDLKLFHLHGEMKQKERTETFHTFSQAKSGILLCTDVAARGLDLPRVDWIVQYTLPGQTVDYIHRIGRTARAGTQGQSLLFLLPSEVDYVKELNNKNLSLSQMGSTKMLRNLLGHINDFEVPRGPNYKREQPRTTEEAATFLQDRFEEILRKDKDLHEVAGKGFQSYIRAYSTYSKEVKAILKARELHLGHVAKSFGLREAPSKVHRISAKTVADAKKDWKDKKMRSQSRPLTFKQAALSEYSSGFKADQKNNAEKNASDKSGYTRGFNNKSGYDRGFNNKSGYDRGFNNKSGYDRGFNNKSGYDRGFNNKSGFDGGFNNKFKRKAFDDRRDFEPPPVKKPKNTRILFE